MARKKEERAVRGPDKSERKSQQYRSGNKSSNKFDKDNVSSSSASACSTSENVPEFQREPGVNPQDAYLQPSDQHFINFRRQLIPLGLTLRDIQGDGNCLFRALADQLEGHSTNHFKMRMETVRYMIHNKKDFEPFMDMPFEQYMDSLSRLGSYAGQDALVAFARMYKLRIVIHQLNSPLWQIEGSSSDDSRELHLSYHNGEHYSSVRLIGDSARSPSNIRLSSLSCTAIPCCTNSVATSTPPVSVSAVSQPSTTLVSSQVKSGRPYPAFLDSATEDDLDSGAEWIAAAQTNNSEQNPPGQAQDLVDQLMQCTGCTDPDLAQQVLIDHHGNLEEAVDHLIAVNIWMNNTDQINETPTNCDNDGGEQQTGKKQDRARLESKQPAVPKKHLSNRERKEQRRREKSERQADRRAQDIALREHEAREQVAHIVSNLGCLNL